VFRQLFVRRLSNGKLQESLEKKTLQSWIPNCITTIANGAYNLLDLLHWALLQTKQSYFNKESLRLFYCGTNGLQLQTTDAR
jgi:hypothetical protein